MPFYLVGLEGEDGRRHLFDTELGSDAIVIVEVGYFSGLLDSLGCTPVWLNHLVTPLS